jgi:hypothetical protein
MRSAYRVYIGVDRFYTLWNVTALDNLMQGCPVFLQRATAVIAASSKAIISRKPNLII